jgi:Holliday junction DNA helicase RuvA
VRVLGVDPGLTRCGLGVVDGGGGRTVRCVDVDVVRTAPDLPIEQRLLAVGATVEEWIGRHRPDVVAIERVFSQHNVRTVMGTAQASGVVALLAARAGLPVAFHTPSEVKAAVTGPGPGRQGAGHRHGHPAARAGRGAPTGRRRGRTGAGRVPLLAEPRCWTGWPRPSPLRRAWPGAPGSGWPPRRGRRPDRRVGPMISSVRGEVLAIGLDQAVLEVGGVGLAVHATPATLATLRRGEQGRLATALIVREDSLTLFGFADDDQRELFHLLLAVAGIGPRMALATLAVLDPDTLRRALVEREIKTLTRVPGIGPKLAERMALELRDKVDAPGPVPPVVAAGSSPRRVQVVEALVGLGFPVRPAEQAVDTALAAQADADASTLLRTALSGLGRT